MKLIIGLVLGSFFSIAAYCDDDPAYPPEPPKPDFRVNIGWAAGFGPEFLGSSHNEFKHRPMLDLRYKRLQIFGPKIRYSLYKEGRLAMGPLFNYSFGRKESDSPLLTGLGNNHNMVELGGFIHYKHRPANFEFRLEGKVGLGDNAGEILTATVIQGLHRREKAALLLVLRSQLFSQSAMQRDFGVTQFQADNSAYSLATYAPSGGISNVSAILLGEYKIKEKTSLMFIGAFWQLMSDADNSPIVRHEIGSSFQSLYGVAFVQKF